MICKYFTAITLSLVLTACGGGGSSVPIPTEPPAPGAPAIVAAYGDSTQEDQGNPHPATRGAITVGNEGVGNTDSSQLLAGTDGRHLPWAQEMARSKSSVIVVNHGINDYRHPLSVYRQNLRDLVTIAQAAGKVVMLEESNPAGLTRTPLMDLVAFDVAAFEVRRLEMRDVATSMGVYFCAQPRVSLADGIHPDAAGRAIKADRLAACLADLLT